MSVPPEIAPFVALIGEHAALLLVEHHGGTRITIPAGAETRLAEQIGAQAAAALFAHFGHERVAVPLAKGWRARLYRERGWSYAAIARKLGCNESTVWKHLNPATGGAQLALPLGGFSGTGIPGKG